MMASATEAAIASSQWLGIPIAVAGAVLLSLGTLFQHRGVSRAGWQQGVAGGSLSRLVFRPAWLGGTLMLGAAIALQLTSLRFSPLIVVQPIGALALVVTTLVTAHISGRRPGRRALTAVILCVGGVGAFVIVAAVWATDVQISDGQLLSILALLGFTLAVIVPVFTSLRRRVNAVSYTAGARVLFGFVAALAKTVIARIFEGHFEWLSLASLTGLVVAAVFGSYLVQSAHSRGSAELVVAGLTVIDPLVAVTIGITVLGEAGTAPPVAVAAFILAGVFAVAGVLLLSTVRDKPHTRPGRLPPAG
ncbi:multidrug DMT transporter permease [Arthrobacter sp. ISL-65]|uniref:multidrug DMT transporter permease n=1 Tax=Arthrobacter sp. ISL-65 TaxID=2819112 RepID=UPI001BED09C7|nr:multidrug DMT transporter permease [Arthrobacter sp. ISL-65]MBT2550983.1 multidrug DMT transporter permease [Arthrobacter sp. ISL-65]